MNDTPSYTLVSDLVTREVAGQVFILMPDSTMHILENPSAVHLHGALLAGPDEGMGVEVLAGNLERHFEVDLEAAREDVKNFVDQLLALGVVRVA